MRYFLAVAALLGLTAAAAQYGESRPPDRLQQPLDSVPLAIGEWQGVASDPLSEREENRLAFTSYLGRRYRKDNREMGVVVVYYARQKAGESMHSPKNCLPGAGWEPWKYERVRVPVGGRFEEVNLYGVRKDQQKVQVLYWYQSRKRIIASEYEGKAMLLWDTLVDGRTGGSLVRLTMPERGGALEDQIQFASQFIPLVQNALGR